MSKDRATIHLVTQDRMIVSTFSSVARRKGFDVVSLKPNNDSISPKKDSHRTYIVPVRSPMDRDGFAVALHAARTGARVGLITRVDLQYTGYRASHLGIDHCSLYEDRYEAVMEWLKDPEAQERWLESRATTPAVTLRRFLWDNSKE